MNKIFAVATLILILAAGCGSPSKKTAEPVIRQPEIKKTETATEQPGKKVYTTVCLACHMADGSGVPGMHPPLIESDFVNGSPEELIKIVLKGLSGKVEIKGEVYNGIMPPQAHLSNEEIAGVLTYIRSNFGNNSGAVTPDEVQKVRDEN